MKNRWNAFFVAGAAFSAASLHAQTVSDTSPMEHPAAGWQALLADPVVLIGALAVAAAVVLVLVLLKRGTVQHDDAGFSSAYDGGYDTIMPPPRKEPVLRPVGIRPVADERSDTVIAPWTVPADFDVPRFLHKAKAAFVRLQKSWDDADLQDIRRFTTRELFAEFCTQLKERAGAPSTTDVVTLGAELLSVEMVDDYRIATVKFSGMIKEDAQPEVAPFSEVWKLSRPLDGHRSWIVTSIEQY